MGVNIRGDAWTQKPNKPFNHVVEGDVLIFNYGGVGKDHVALVTGFVGEVHEGDYIRPEFIKIVEANYSRCKVGTRLIAWDDPKIRGVLSPESTK
jgi:hypothetical protein